MPKRTFDNLHCNTSRIDGTKKTHRAIVSAREGGKTTAWTSKAWRSFKNGSRVVVFRNHSIDFSNLYIDSVFESIEDFFDDFDRNKIYFNNHDRKAGIFDILYNGEKFLTGISLSIPITRIKSTIINNLKFAVYDEFIVNPTLGEKWPRGVAFKLKEAHSSWQRCLGNENLCFYYFGNPYSLYNPIFADWHINTRLLYEKGFIVGGDYVAEYFHLPEALKKQILERNPNHVFDDSYSKYVLGGEPINDIRIITREKCPSGYRLAYVLYVEGKKLSVWRNYAEYFPQFSYWVGYSRGSENGGGAFSFDFENLVHGAFLMTAADKEYFRPFKSAVGNRRVEYENVECGYLIEEIYKMI